MSEITQQDASQEQPEEVSAEDQRLPEKIQVDGEEINLHDAIADHRNKKEWQQTQTQRDQELSAQRREVNDLLNRVIDQVAPNNKQAVEGVAKSFDLSGRMEALPDSIEDKDGFTSGFTDILQDYGDAIKAEVTAQVSTTKTETQQSIVNQSQKDRIVQDNLRMVRESLAKTFGEGISEAEVGEVITRVGMKHGQSYGHGDNSGAFRYNEEAITESMWGVPSLRTKLIAEQTNEARKEGLTGRQAGQQGLSPTNRAVSRPGQNAPISEKIEWLRGHSEPEMHRVVANMNADERNQMLKSLFHDER